jgi:NAD(P)-dependent dehydrogenase (short-subunit alcohol dehydrogenase family)
VIHTAGISPSMGTADLIMRVNALGTLHINEGFYPLAGDGFAIVNVASMAAHLLPRIAIPAGRFKYALRNEELFMNKSMAACAMVPQRWRPALAYALSKSFVTWYCRSQAARFGHRGARIISVSPGSIDTEMGRLEKATGAGAVAGHAALRRFGTAEEVAQLLAFCASEGPGYLTGVDILCDGGAVASMTVRDKLAASKQD